MVGSRDDHLSVRSMFTKWCLLKESSNKSIIKFETVKLFIPYSHRPEVGKGGLSLGSCKMLNSALLDLKCHI